MSISVSEEDPTYGEEDAVSLAMKLAKDPYELSRTKRCIHCAVIATQDDIIVHTGLNISMEVGKHLYNYLGSKCKLNEHGKHGHEFKGIFKSISIVSRKKK